MIIECIKIVVMNGVSSPSVGASPDGFNDLAAARAVDNVVEQPATVTMPTPVAMNSLGHGTIHGNSIAVFHDSLAEFLSRPVLIRSLATTTGASDKFYPWELFLGDTLVAEKVRAFGFIRGTLHVRFVMSVSQFVQGRVYVSYNPAGKPDDDLYGRGDTVNTMSHLPFAGYMDPGLGNDLEWSIPFHEGYPYRTATTVSLGSNLGGVIYSRVSYPFENASTGSPSGTQIRVLAWMTDVELVVAAVPQSGQSAIPSRALQLATSGISAVKALVGEVSASQMAHRVGDALAAFGYTREADSRDYMPVRQRTTAGWAVTEGAEQSYALTTDPFAEKTLATDYVTGFSRDEMTIAFMAGRYSYATTVTWTDSSTTPLWTAYVHPDEYTRTCLTTVSNVFSYWRGSIRYKLSTVRTPFHKGKLLVKWAPHSQVVDASLNTGYSVIWDLDSTPEIEITVPYNRGDYWSRTSPPVEEAVLPNTANGFITLHIMESLTGPSDTVFVPIDIFVAGGSDIAFSCPTYDSLRYTGFGAPDPEAPYSRTQLVNPFPNKGVLSGPLDPVFPQGGEVDMTLTNNHFVLGPASSSHDAALRSMGEQTLSFRELLKRKARAITWTANTDALLFVPTYPKSPISLISWVDAGTTQLQESPYSPTLMNYLMGLFMGVRGSTKWDFTNGNSTSPLMIVRGFGHAAVGYNAPTAGVLNGSMNGAAMSTPSIDGVASVIVPQYIRGHYSLCANYMSDLYMSGVATTSPDFSTIADNGVFIKTPAPGALVEGLVAAGDDFNLLYYLGPPPTNLIP